MTHCILLVWLDSPVNNIRSKHGHEGLHHGRENRNMSARAATWAQGTEPWARNPKHGAKTDTWVQGPSRARAR